MNKKKILICGVTGFIGRNATEKFAQNPNYKVTGTYFNSSPWHSKNVEMVKADLTQREDVERVVKGKDILIQMAATTSGVRDIINKPYFHVTDNIITNSLIFREAFEQNVSHVIFPSCATMYQSSEKPSKEIDFELDKIPKEYHACGQQKVYLEQQCELFAGLGKTKYTAMRHSNTYGPYDKYDLKKSHVFGATITKVMTARGGDSITVWGDGQEERDLLYVSDVISFIEKAIDKQKTQFELINVGRGKSISISDLVKKIIEISGKDLKIEYDTSKPTIKTRVSLDCTKAKEKFDWSPKISLDEGIKKTMDWYKENLL